MPQLQAGQAPAGVQAPKLYGVYKPSQNEPFQEKLYQMFKPQEFVTIKNVDDEPIFWQYLPDDKESFAMSDDGMQKQTFREQPEQWYLGAGETDVLVGANAYRALDVMYKAVAAKSTLKKFRDPASPLFNKDGQHLPKNFNFADGGLQDEVIGSAYLGKATPVFDGYQPQTPVATGVDPAIGQSQSITQVAPAPVIATPAFPDLPVNANPMVADPTLIATATAVEEPIVRPKTTEGAPLVAPTYATPELEETATPTADAKAKVVANEPASKN